MHLRANSKFFIRSRDIQSAPRLTVRFIGSPANLAFKASEPRDQLHQFRYLYFVPGADVDRFAFVVNHSGTNNCFGAVSYVKKFARSVSGAPGFDKGRAVLSSFDTLANQRWDH